MTVKFSDAAKRHVLLATLLTPMRLEINETSVGVAQDFVFDGYTDAEVIECGRRLGLKIKRESKTFVIRQGKPMQDVMIDIETMALHPSNALILSIGLVEFDPTGDELLLGERIIIRPDIAHQLLLGRSVEAATQKFWADQPTDAQDDWRIGRVSTLKEAADQIAAFTQPAKRLWANGIVFDIGNVASLIRQAGNSEPWHYRAPRDMRTLCEHFPVRNNRTSEVSPSLLGTGDKPHMALYDCIVQAHHVWQHWPEAAELMHHPV